MPQWHGEALRTERPEHRKDCMTVRELIEGPGEAAEATKTPPKRGSVLDV